MSTPQTHHFAVTRTARYVTIGAPGPAIKEVWIVCHGYGQLAAPFVQGLATLDDGTRWIVAPEGLSRFYLESTDGRRNRLGPVGASWMTREDRDTEIDDQIAYLNHLHDHLFTQIDRSQVHLTILGFSQGGATICRWVARTTIHADRLICWGSNVPDDVVALGADVFRHMPLWMVIGNRDLFVPAERIAEFRQSLDRAQVPYHWLSFNGGHRLDNETLRQIAGTTVAV